MALAGRRLLVWHINPQGHLVRAQVGELLFMASEPQMPWRHDLRKLRLGCIAFRRVNTSSSMRSAVPTSSSMACMRGLWPVSGS